MSDAAVALTTRSKTSKPAAGRRLLVLLLGLTFVLASRLILYAWAPDRATDFDFLYSAAARLVSGQAPYQAGTQWFPYPLPGVLLAVPFTVIPLDLARPIFDVLVGWVFVYALWRYRGSFALLAVLSGAYLFALRSGQTTPLMVAASLIPAIGFLLAVRPNTSAALWIARPTWMALLGASAFLILSLAVLPSWPHDWWMALPEDIRQLKPPIMRPFGFVLLLAALRWRLPEARLILAMAFVPQSTLPYELVSLALIPATLPEMGVYVAGTWVTVVAADRLHFADGLAAWAANGWPMTICAVYLPMLYLVLRRGDTSKVLKFGKDRRRPHRVPDDQLSVQIISTGRRFTVKVTHLPTQLSATESGRNRELTQRKAHDKLAAILAETSRLAREA
jgi:hypothetical protein